MKKEIENLIKKSGYKKIGKDIIGNMMYEKGNEVIYFTVVKHKKPKKEETFKERTKKLYEK